MDLGLNGMELVAVEAAGVPFNQPPPAAENPAGMELVIYATIPHLNVKDLPPQKRILGVVREERNEEGFACNICGRIFPSTRSLGGHRSHHNVGPTRKRKRAAADRVVFVVHGVSRRQCRGCGRVFRSARGVAAHIRFCRGVDLNGPPPVELVEEVLALPWL